MSSLLAAALLVLAPVARAWGPSAPPSLPLGRVIAVEGAVEFKSAGAADYVKLAGAPSPLSPGDHLRTGPRGRAAVMLRDGSRLEVGQSTVFTVENDDPSYISILLSLGRLRAAVSKRPGRLFQIASPSAVAAVRGTEFTMEARIDGTSLVEVAFGQVSVYGHKDGDPIGKEVLLRAGQRVNVGAAGPGPIGAAAGFGRESVVSKGELKREAALLLDRESLQVSAAKASANPAAAAGPLQTSVTSAASGAVSASGPAAQTATTAVTTTVQTTLQTTLQTTTNLLNTTTTRLSNSGPGSLNSGSGSGGSSGPH